MAMEVSDRMLQLRGGFGYSRKAGIERLVHDARAGWIMGPNNEITRQIVGRWALPGAEAADFWNQRVNEPLLLNELDKLDDDDRVIRVEDNLGLVRQCREHFDPVGFGADLVDQMIRGDGLH